MVSAPPPPAIARAALITRAQLGSGWQERPAAARKVPPLSCSGFAPGAAAAHVAATAQTGRFQATSSGPFISQQAFVYATPTEGNAVAGAVIKPALVRCVASGLTRASGNGTTYVVSREHGLSLPRLPVSAGGYRVVAGASQAGQSIGTVYLDAIVLAHGRTVTEISFATFNGPPQRPLELRLARAVARRIARD